MLSKNQWRLLFLSLAFITSSLHSQEWAELVSSLESSQVQQLENQGKLIRYAKGEAEPLWFPMATDNLDVLEQIRRVNSGAMIEVFYTIDGEFTRQDKISLINTFLDISGMQDIEYYNPDHEEWHPVFDESFAIDSLNTREAPQANPQLTYLPRTYDLLVHQDLPPVGWMVSQIDISNQTNLLEVSSKNLTSLNYGIVPVITEGNFFFEIRVFFLEGKMVFYGCGGVNFFNPFNIFGDKIDPFFYRFEGIFEHYNSAIEPLLKDEA